MSKNLNISLLMDFYGQLLTDKQLAALEYYYNDDLSLAEIADEMNISRQGVRDFIKRGEKQLDDFEQKLGLSGRFDKVRNKIEQINNSVDALEKKIGGQGELVRLKELVSEVTEEL